MEIVSPSNKQEEIDAKVELYLESGVRMVWGMNPRFRTIIVHQPQVEPAQYNASQVMVAEAILPEFRVPVADPFGRRPDAVADPIKIG